MNLNLQKPLIQAKIISHSEGDWVTFTSFWEVRNSVELVEFVTNLSMVQFKRPWSGRQRMFRPSQKKLIHPSMH